MSVEVRAALDVDLDALIQLNRVIQSLHVALYPGDFTPVVEATCGERVLRSTTCQPDERDRDRAGGSRACGLRSLVRSAGATGNAVYSPPRSRISVHHMAVAPEARSPWELPLP